ncbi:MAG: MmgE/PrpD family protein [Salinarimonadaceae bacterium]|nr:MAG: MmgE/PrpD family protein [Salinarimonadaceae bacterium]
MNFTNTVDASASFARFIASTDYDSLSEGARESARRCILDTLGVTAAATTLGLGHPQLEAMVRKAGGAAESSVVGFGGRLPIWLAALVNGAMARAVDFDDGHDESMTHPSSVIVTAAIAMAERRGGVSGRDLITAVAVGNEILVRLGLAIARGPDGLKLDTWFPSSVFGAFGGTAACCSILKFDAEHARSALGIALFEASGTLEAFSSTGQKSMMRGMVTGLTAKSATLAATMVEAGIIGVPDSIEGEFGLFNVYFGGKYDRGTLLDGLGEVYHSADIGMKPWPTCRYTHAYIDAALQLVRDDGLKSDDVEKVRIHVAGYAQSRCEPLAQQRRPHNFNHAGHALPYLVAAAMVRGRITLSDLINDLDDPAVFAVADRVEPVHDPRFSIENKIGPARIEVELKNGDLLVKQTEVVLGGLGNPMSWEDLAAKFRSCVAFSVNPPSPEATERLIDSLGRLEQVADIGDVIRDLA